MAFWVKLLCTAIVFGTVVFFVAHVLIGISVIPSLAIVVLLMLIIWLSGRNARPAPPLKMNESCWNEPDE